MKKNKVLYYVCKALNWVHWFILMAICSVLSTISGGSNNDLFGYAFIVFLGHVVFAIFWFLFSSTRSRLLYQVWFFLGYIYAEYCMFFAPDGGFLPLDNDINATAFQKLILTLVCICAFACKIFTMSYETGDYNRGASKRHNNRLDDRIYAATYDLEHARTAEDKRRAEAKLERAKLDRERFSWDEDN